jgi:predicted nuclease of predicted toxin-antitoxin system
MHFLTDENFNNNILRRLDQHLRDHPEDIPEHFEITRVQDVGLRGKDDPAILEWAAVHLCILLTHDASTIPFFAYARVKDSHPMPGVFLVRDSAPIGEIVEQLLLIATYSELEEWENKVEYLPKAL